MKKNFFRRLMLLVTLLFLFSSVSVLASEETGTLPQEVTFDLNSNQVQNFVVSDSNRETIKVSLEPLVSSARVANGSYRVTYTVPDTWTAKFIVSVTNNRITAANSLSIQPIACIIVSSNLYLNASSQALLDIGWKAFGSGTIAYNTIKAYISNASLKVSFT